MTLTTPPNREPAIRLRAITPATTGSPLTYFYACEPGESRADLDAITEDTHRRDAETKTALSRLALGQLEIKALLHELIAETRAREPRTDYPHEATDTDDRFV